MECLEWVGRWLGGWAGWGADVAGGGQTKDAILRKAERCVPAAALAAYSGVKTLRQVP